MTVPELADLFYYHLGCKEFTYTPIDGSNVGISGGGRVLSMRECMHMCAMRGRTVSLVCIGDCDESRDPDMRRMAAITSLTAAGVSAPNATKIARDYLSGVAVNAALEYLAKRAGMGAVATVAGAGDAAFSALELAYAGVQIGYTKRVRDHIKAHGWGDKNTDILADPDFAVEMVKKLQGKGKVAVAGDILRQVSRDDKILLDDILNK